MKWKDFSGYEGLELVTITYNDPLFKWVTWSPEPWALRKWGFYSAGRNTINWIFEAYYVSGGLEIENA